MPENGSRGAKKLATRRGDYYISNFDMWNDRHSAFAVAEVLKPGAKVSVVGSCFAIQAAKYLRRRGYDAWSHPSGELYNAQLIHIELAHVLAGQAWPEDPVLAVPHGFTHRFRKRCSAQTEEALRTLDAAHTAESRQTLLDADVIITLIGTTTEVWHDPATGLPANEIPHPAIFSSRDWSLDLGSVDALRREIRGMQQLIAEHTTASQVYAVCPVPLNATWCDGPIIAANGRTKALLRVALDLELDAEGIYLDLWDWVQAQTGDWTPMSGDGRHFDRGGVDRIMHFAEARLGADPGPLTARHRLRSGLGDTWFRLREVPGLKALGKGRVGRRRKRVALN